MLDVTATTGAGTFSTRWVDLPSAEMHRLAFELINGKGPLYVESLLAMMLEIETGGRFESIWSAA